MANLGAAMEAVPIAMHPKDATCTKYLLMVSDL